MSKWWRVSVVAVLLTAGTAQAQSSADKESGLERSADALLIGVPAVALGLTWLLDRARETDLADGSNLNFSAKSFMRLNGSPRHDLGVAMMRSVAVTYGLKGTIDEERPNGEGGSFPSGHTAVTFTGAEFIRKQYGWGWGAPAYAAAGFVGWSRVETRDHWWHDVAAGAAIGILSNHDLLPDWLKLRPAIMVPSTPSSQWQPTSLLPADSTLGLRLEFTF